MTASRANKTNRRPFTAPEIVAILAQQRAGMSIGAIAKGATRHRASVSGLIRAWLGFEGNAAAVLTEMHRRMAEPQERRHRVGRPANGDSSDDWQVARPLDEPAVAALHRAHGGFKDVRFMPWPRAGK